MQPPSWSHAFHLAIEWARDNHIGPLQTFLLGSSIIGLFFFARFVRGARNVVDNVHNVYEKALLDQKKAADNLRWEVDNLQVQRRLLLDELEDERKVKEDLLRSLAKLRAQAASNPPPQE